MTAGFTLSIMKCKKYVTLQKLMLSFKHHIFAFKDHQKFVMFGISISCAQWQCLIYFSQASFIKAAVRISSSPSSSRPSLTVLWVTAEDAASRAQAAVGWLRATSCWHRQLQPVTERVTCTWVTLTLCGGSIRPSIPQLYWSSGKADRMHS